MVVPVPCFSLHIQFAHWSGGGRLRKHLGVLHSVDAAFAENRFGRFGNFELFRPEKVRPALNYCDPMPESGEYGHALRASIPARWTTISTIGNKLTKESHDSHGWDGKRGVLNIGL
jgi:hypothetical protein